MGVELREQLQWEGKSACFALVLMKVESRIRSCAICCLSAAPRNDLAIPAILDTQPQGTTWPFQPYLILTLRFRRLLKRPFLQLIFRELNGEGVVLFLYYY